ncbi:hypothetical protein [Nostoc sp.]|uniref:hypothetical protein n=1 Tax=Nostoc sp. TaxID=1180 RepID=UPI0035934009
MHRPATLMHRPATLVHRLATLVHRPATLMHRLATLVHRLALIPVPHFLRGASAVLGVSPMSDWRGLGGINK